MDLGAFCDDMKCIHHTKIKTVYSQRQTSITKMRLSEARLYCAQNCQYVELVELWFEEKGMK